MSTFDSDDLGVTGYFLPEDSQLRLKQLGEYVGFLTNLARPRRPDEDREWFSEIRPGEVAICLELLEEQIAIVLDELSWPAERGERATACEPDADGDGDGVVCTEAEEPEVAKPAMDEAGKRFVFGMTLDQVDESNWLLSSLRALGNVVTCTDHAELSDATLSVMGDAIVRDVEQLRRIILDVSSHCLTPSLDIEPGVSEESATYLTPPPLSPLDGTSYTVRESPSCH